MAKSATQEEGHKEGGFVLDLLGNGGHFTGRQEDLGTSLPVFGQLG